ncbi:MAG: hypothetical protein IKQ10_10285 [Oscillospiraceae bacterium]|nr:hypothetical protein [Oscillospiraceae bacterium]
MNSLDFVIDTQQDLIDAVERLGFLPFFSNSIPGFSVEEHVAPGHWYDDSESGGWDAWEWKGPVIRQTGCAYGKFFEHKAVFVSRGWFADLANFRRDGYDFDALYDDGKARRQDKELYELVEENAPILTDALKSRGDYRKGGRKGFDTAIVRLQTQCYAVISDFVYRTDRHGRPYGWGVAEYSTPERSLGAGFTENVYRRSPEESYERVFEHLRAVLPGADEKILRRILRQGAVTP